MSEKVPFVRLDQEYRQLQSELDAAITDVLKRGRFVLDERVDEFEDRFAEYVGSTQGVGVNSGTDALFLALSALGVGDGDEVIVPSHTFRSTADAVMRNGATPVFVDVDPETYLIDPEDVRRKITDQTEAIIPVHLYGQPADMDPLLKLATQHDFAVIEDAAQAHGARYRGEPVGSMGDVACFSFYPTKNLGAYGDAGMIVTDDSDIVDSLRTLRDIGSTEKYQYERIGVNSRLDELQAAILLTKLEYLDEWNERRRWAARRYTESLTDTDVTPPTVRGDAEHVYHLYVIETDRRNELQKALEEEGVHSLIHYPVPIHEQRPYVDQFDASLPVTEQITDRILSLPMHPWITEDQIDRVVSTIHDTL